jgi:hypothetical protein
MRVRMEIVEGNEAFVLPEGRRECETIAGCFVYTCETDDIVRRDMSTDETEDFKGSGMQP